MRKAVIGFSFLYAGTWLVALPFTSTEVAALAACLAAPLIWLSAVDLSRLIIPDAAVLTIAAINLGFAGFLMPSDTPFFIAAAAAVLLAFWLLGEIYFRLRGRDGFGMGDAKLLGAFTLAAGPGLLWQVIFLGALGGIAAIVAGRATGKKQIETAVPFGPFLAYAYFLILLIFVEI